METDRVRLRRDLMRWCAASRENETEVRNGLISLTDSGTAGCVLRNPDVFSWEGTEKNRMTTRAAMAQVIPEPDAVNVFVDAVDSMAL